MKMMMETKEGTSLPSFFLRERPNENVFFPKFYAEEKERIIDSGLRKRAPLIEESLFYFSLWLIESTLLKAPISPISCSFEQEEKVFIFLDEESGKVELLFRNCKNTIGSNSFKLFYIKEKKRIEEMFAGDSIVPKEGLLFPYFLSVHDILISIPAYLTD